MTLSEFAALKAGDKIANNFTHAVGTISSVDPSGVKVQWSTPPTVDFFYSVNSTSWFNWSKVT